MHNSASTNQITTEKMTTTTMTMTAALWFHDAVDADDFEQEKRVVMTNDDNDNDNDDGYCCENCRMMDLQQQWDEHLVRMQQHKYGVCIDCGVGLNYEDEFLVDRRETQCDCFTCDSCFTHFHGNDALYQAVHWAELGKPIPQFVRISCLTP
jgi:RNA polymerase-binding transcription factor DksA